jgi:hypothetical protein
VRGSFWHRHTCKDGARIPEINAGYWVSKIDRNVACDLENEENPTMFPEVDLSRDLVRSAFHFFRFLRKYSVTFATKRRNSDSDTIIRPKPFKAFYNEVQ